MSKNTADGYAGGQSETMLGKLLAPHRIDVIIYYGTVLQNGGE
jgi:aryl-alcohol dehydrogenase-like predicted oxidoreductase